MADLKFGAGLCFLFATFVTVCCAISGPPDNQDLGGMFLGGFLIAEIICVASYILCGTETE